MPFQDGNWSLMAFPDICLWRQSLHRLIFCILFHADDWILLHYEKGLDKPLTHVKTDCGLGFFRQRDSFRNDHNLWDTQEHPVCCHNDSEMHDHGADSLFPSSVSACLHFQNQLLPAISCLRKSPQTLSVGFALFPLYFHFSPIRNEAVAASFVGHSTSLTPSLAAPTFRFSSAASEWFLVSAPQMCSSFLTPGTTVPTSTTTVWIIFSNAASEHHVALFT